MAESIIPVDLFNPGQVFACLGFMELADQLQGNACGAFNWSDGNRTLFILRTDGEQPPVKMVLECLARAQVISYAPIGSPLSTDKWNITTKTISNYKPYPFKIPNSPATLPARLEFDYNGKTFSYDITHWGDSSDRDNVKFWAGSNGYPGVALLQDALDLIRDEAAYADSDPFSLSSGQSSSFRFDWRRDYVALDAGFSPNEHKGSIVMVGYPLVEILAAIGLENARPWRTGRSKLEYKYCVLGTKKSHEPYPLIFIRAALGCSDLPFPQRKFQMQLDWPGQAGQARCIVNVTEETE